MPSPRPPHTRRRRRRVGTYLVGLLGLIAVGLVMRAATTPLQAWDLRVVEKVARSRTPTLTVTAHALSYLGRTWVLGPLAVLIDGVVRRGRARWALTAGVAAAVVVQNATKAIVRRPRPPVEHLEHVTSSSFPSGHATQVTAFVVSLALPGILARSRHPWRDVLCALLGTGLALAVAGSRVYLGVHYPTDVIAGVLLGGGCGLLACLVTAPGACATDES